MTLLSQGDIFGHVKMLSSQPSTMIVLDLTASFIVETWRGQRVDH